MLGARVSLFLIACAYFTATFVCAFWSPHHKAEADIFFLLQAPPAPKSTFQECLSSFVRMQAKVRLKHLSLVGWRGGVPQM